MQILLNGEPFTTEARDLASLCAALGFADARIATALNGSFVAACCRAGTKLAEADEIEILAPRQGG